MTQHGLGASLVRAVIVVGSVALGMLYPATAGAQQVTTLNGVVVDPAGVAVPGVTITVSVQGRHVATTVSDETGRFSVPRLASGEATVRAELQGFQQSVIKVRLVPGAAQSVRFVMGQGLTEVLASVPSASPRASPSPKPARQPMMWNAWMERAPGQSFQPVTHLRPGARYSLTVDLAGLDYSTSGDGIASREISSTLGDALDTWLRENPDLAQTQLTILLVPDPRAIRAADGSAAQDLDISLARLRTFLAADRNEVPADALRHLSTEPDAAFVFGRVRFTIETDEHFKGQASIGLSIWDGMRPVDELVLTFCVAPDRDASQCRRTGAIAQSLRGIDAARLGTGDAPSYPDVALHFIEFPGNRVVGALRQKDWTPTTFLTWPLQVSAMELRARLGVLARDLGDADNESGHRRTGAALYGLLLPLPSAQRARAALEAFLKPLLAERPFEALSPPSLFIRHITSGVQNGPFIPAGFMYLAELQTFLGYYMRAETPLPLQTYEPSQACINQWVMLVPGETVSDNSLKTARTALSDKRTAWENAGARVFGDIQSFSDWIGADENDGTPTVLGVLSHHEDDRLRFAVNDHVYAETMHRGLGQSVAILSACESAPPGPAAIVRRLNLNGVVAVIATSSKVRPELGGAMLRELAAVAEARERTSAESLSALFRRAQARVWEDAAPEERSNVLKYMLLGNGGVTVCGPSTGSGR